MPYAAFADFFAPGMAFPGNRPKDVPKAGRRSLVPNSLLSPSYTRVRVSALNEDLFSFFVYFFLLWGCGGSLFFLLYFYLFSVDHPLPFFISGQNYSLMGFADSIRLSGHATMRYFSGIMVQVRAAAGLFAQVGFHLGSEAVAPCVFVGLEDGGGVAAAVRVPPGELEVLRVAPLQLVADVVEVEDELALMAHAGVVVAQVHLYAHHEVHLLPALVVGRASTKSAPRCQCQ